jgi:RNA polymerase sigma-70 factor (ECF subfamily)
VVSSEHDFDAIWREAGPAIWRAIYAYAGGRREVADDAVAEAFARAMVRTETIRLPVPYLYRTAFRIAAQELRSMNERTELVDRPVTDPEGPIDVLLALRHLTPSQRASIFLFYGADLPVRDVASAMGTSGAAVRVHLMRARRRLADLLTEDDEETVHE